MVAKENLVNLALMVVTKVKLESLISGQITPLESESSPWGACYVRRFCKNPKSKQKKSSQKDAKTSSANQKKSAAVAAKSSAGKKK